MAGKPKILSRIPGFGFLELSSALLFVTAGFTDLRPKRVVPVATRGQTPCRAFWEVTLDNHKEGTIMSGACWLTTHPALPSHV